MKARKKPVVIECFQYDGDFMNADGVIYIPEWAYDAYKSKVLQFRNNADLFVKTLEGEMKVEVNDYVIRGVNGELYPCKPDIFKKTYDVILNEKRGN